MAEATTSATSETVKKAAGFHLEPLDGLRFFAAMWVALHHGRKPLNIAEFPPFELFWDGGFFGVAGVLAFFVISGICIHYPTASTGKAPRWGSFLIRRYTRVLVPYWVILPLALLVGKPYSILFGGSVAWTLFCELGFYLLYPFLYSLAKSIGWVRVSLIACVPSLVLVVFRYQTPVDLGAFLNIFVFLPCWLMGCVIAEKFVRHVEDPSRQAPAPANVYAMRAVVVLAQAVVGFLSITGILYHRFLSIPLSFIMAYWIWTEMRFYIGKTPSRVIAWAGTWSYSLYLMHEVINGATVPLFYKLPSLHPSIVFLANTTLILIASYVFALLVEWPSQKLARFVSKRVGF